MRRVSIPDPAGAGEKLAYEYRVGGDWYRTTELIQEDRALDIVTRALRIWKVRKIVQHDDDVGKRKLGDETYVLKDALPYEDAQCEQLIQQTMYDRLGVLDERDGGTRKVDAPQYFMTILHDAPVMIDGEFDTARHPVSTRRFVRALSKAAPARERLPIRFECGEAGRSTVHEKTFRMQCRGRTHWRTLYKEVCKDLYTVTSPRVYFKALSTVVKGSCSFS